MSPLVGSRLSDSIKGFPPAESVVVLPNGNKEHKYHLSFVDKSCYHYWIVDDKEIVVAYRYTGRCHGI